SSLSTASPPRIRGRANVFASITSPPNRKAGRRRIGSTDDFHDLPAEPAVPLCGDAGDPRTETSIVRNNSPRLDDC
ncbi:hypothetical protein, partial [Acinetobacter baumannii]|uniref:hypothetical protein n=1 Tax=Acinetobacter baumannii TaxID=470 RepID=UPI001C08D235